MVTQILSEMIPARRLDMLRRDPAGVVVGDDSEMFLQRFYSSGWKKPILLHWEKALEEPRRREVK